MRSRELFLAYVGGCTKSCSRLIEKHATVPPANKKLRKKWAGKYCRAQSGDCPVPSAPSRSISRAGRNLSRAIERTAEEMSLLDVRDSRSSSCVLRLRAQLACQRAEARPQEERSRGRRSAARSPPQPFRHPAWRNRSRARQKGSGRSQPPPGRLGCQEIRQSRTAPARPDPGRQHRPDARSRQVRISPRLQVLDLRHVVDPPGDHPRHRRSVPHHSHSRFT